MAHMNPESDELVKDEKIRPHNGWTPEIENLIADWSDRSQCYRWMHDRTSRAYATYNQYMMIPVIILSTLTGTANFGLDSIFQGNTANKTYASLGIGGVSIVTGIISTLANFLRYGQGSEAHALSALMWGKFSRLISIELALHPDDRMEAFAFLKMFRIELDRLVEQAPVISDTVINQFKREFRTALDVKKPDIAGVIDHTKVFENKDERMKQIAADASFMLLNKKKFFKDLVMEEIDDKVKKLIAESKARGSPFLDRNKDNKNTIVNPTSNKANNNNNSDDDNQSDIVIDVDKR
jgi:hypothetical protein